MLNYKIILSKLEDKPSDTWFNEMLTHFIRYNDFKSTEFLLEKTVWDKENSRLKNGLIDCFYYKRTKFPLMYKIFSSLSYKEYKFKDYSIDITTQRSYQLDDIIELSIKFDKLKFLPPLAKLEGDARVYNKALEFIVQKGYVWTLLDLHANEPSILNNYINDKSEQYWEFRKINKLDQLMDINDDTIDKEIISHLDEIIFKKIILIKFNTNKSNLAKKWITKLENNELLFNKNLFSMEDMCRSIIRSDHIHIKTIFTLWEYPESHKYAKNVIPPLIGRVMRHNKLGLLKEIKSRLILDKILFTNNLIYDYFSENYSPELEKFLSTEVDFSILTLGEKLNMYSSHRKAIALLKDIHLSKIEEKTKLFPSIDIKQLSFDY